MTGTVSGNRPVAVSPVEKRFILYFLIPYLQIIASYKIALYS